MLEHSIQTPSNGLFSYLPRGLASVQFKFDCALVRVSSNCAVAADLGGKLEITSVGFPVGAGAVEEIEAVLLGGDAGDSWLEEDVRFGLCDEAEDGDERPRENARLPARETGDDLDPALEAAPDLPRAVRNS